MGSENKDNLIIIRVDLGDLKTIDEFVAAFNGNEKVGGRLDVLVCNAGVVCKLDCSLNHHFIFKLSVQNR